MYKPCEILYSIEGTHREFCELAKLGLGSFTMVPMSGFEILCLLNTEANFQCECIICNCNRILPRDGVRDKITVIGIACFERGFEKESLCASGETDFDLSCTKKKGDNNKTMDFNLIHVDFYLV